MPPLNSILPLEVPVSVCLSGSSAPDLPVVWTCFALHFVSVHGVVV